jgi:predicted ATPase
MATIRKPNMPALRGIDEYISVATKKLSRLQYVGPFRDAPLRAYPLSGERPSILTSTGKGATDVLVADFFRRGSRKRVLSKSVQSWLSRANIASELQVHTLGDRQYDIRLKHPITGEIENLADVGYGISQVLPILVAGYNQEPSSVFLVEQPELHLHPRAQSELGDFFCDLYDAGVQSIIETHSEHLILRLQRHVASGRVPTKDVAVNFVHSGDQGKIVTPLPLNEDGIFTEKWPQGFFEERLDEALSLARAPLIRKGELE